jgi:hypothetical protein
VIARAVTAIVLVGHLMVCPALFAAGKNVEKLADDNVVVDETTEAVIKSSLKWLAAQQAPSGAWSTAGNRRDSSKDQTVAMTGYVLIAFLAAGHLPNEGEHSKVVNDGMKYLLDSIQPDGKFMHGGSKDYMYGHGIATIALAELYGQTRSPLIRTKLERAIALIVRSQNDKGGWRYQPRVADADISVTVLQLVALRAAKNAGLDVPQSAIEKGVQYVHSCYEKGSGGFSYQPGSGAGFARTAAAIYSLQVCGRYDDERVKTGSEYLFKKRDDKQWFTYGNFYAAPAQYMIGGETWEKWYGQIRDQLLRNVKRQGELAYWEPFADNKVGPVFATAVYTTILAMPYHYIPLYQR